MTYNFHISNLLVTTKMHIQCLVEGSILAGVFLTSSFCVVPESSYPSNAPVSNLLVAWSSNCSTAASSTKSMVASFKNLQFHLEAFEFMMIACCEHQSSMLSYFTDHASSPRPPLRPLFSLTISKKQLKKTTGTSHKKVFRMKTSACRDGTLKNQPNKMGATLQHIHTIPTSCAILPTMHNTKLYTKLTRYSALLTPQLST